jgi:hypothetical protein
MSLDPAQRFESLSMLGAALSAFADGRTAAAWEGVFDPRGSAGPAWVPRPSMAPLYQSGPATPLPGTLEGRSLDVSQRMSAPPGRSRTGWLVAGGLLSVCILAGGAALVGRASPSTVVTPAARVVAPAPPAPAPVAVAPAAPAVVRAPAAPPRPAAPVFAPPIQTPPVAPAPTPAPAVRAVAETHDRRRHRRSTRDLPTGAPVNLQQPLSSQGSGTNAMPIVQ